MFVPTRDTGGRLLLLTGLFLCAWIIIILRLTGLAFSEENAGMESATYTPTTNSPTRTRADIIDRNGLILATSLVVPSIYADPAHILDPVETATKLLSVFPALSSKTFLQKLTKKSRFVWIKRHVTPAQKDQVNRLGLAGIYFRNEEKRIYPAESEAAHIIGYTDIDNHGLAGFERIFEERLMTQNTALQVSVDLRLQHILYRVTKQTTQEFRAKGAAALIMDINNGEVLASVSLPDFNPHHPGQAPMEARFNRPVQGVYEMGSLFKIFTTALALDSGRVQLSDIFDVQEPIRVGNFTIKDFYGKKRPLSVSEIFIYSSNIGSVKMALKTGTEKQKSFLRALGLTKKPALVPKKWREINTMTIAFGHGLATTSLQMAAATASIINGGLLVSPMFLKQSAKLSGTRVISTKTSQKMKNLLRLEVQKGTGKKANVPGYAVGGKTGTTEKVKKSGYQKDAILSSFIGVFPMNNPRYLVFMMIDEPHGTSETHGHATGGHVAAPTVARIIKQMAPLMGIPKKLAKDTHVIL